MAYQDQFYTTGRVSVTKGSATVIGTATGWQTALVESGVLYVGGTACPILSVQSETRLTLAIPYNGDTGSNLVYAIDRQRSAAVSNIKMNDRLSEIIASITAAQPNNDLLTAFAALNGTKSDVLAYFTGAKTMEVTTLTSFARGLLAAKNTGDAYLALGSIPNNQLPERLSVQGQYTTDANTITWNGFSRTDSGTSNVPSGDPATLLTTRYSDTGTHQRWSSVTRRLTYERMRNNSAWTAWELVTIPIIGNVSQSGGVPTGSLFQRGSNANGEFMRAANGLQICWKHQNAADTVIIDTATGSNFRGTKRWTFPAAFAGSPVTSGSLNDYRGGAMANAAITNAYVDMVANLSVARPEGANWNGTAIGWWF